MIKYVIVIEDGKIQDNYEDKETTLAEVALAIYRLEEVKLMLMSKEFENEFEAKQEGDDE